MKLVEALIPHSGDHILIGLIKSLLAIVIVPILFLTVFTLYSVLEFKHYWLYLKNNQSHKPKHLIIRQQGSLVQAQSSNECTCGRTSPPRNVIEVMENIINRCANLIGI